MADRQVIFLERKNGSKLSDLAKKFEISIERVRKIVKTIETTGRAQNEHRSGRPRVTTPRDDRRYIRLVHANPKTTAGEIKEKIQLNVGLETVRTRLHEANFFGRIARNKPYINEVNRKKRLNFARQFVNYPKEFWHEVL